MGVELLYLVHHEGTQQEHAIYGAGHQTFLKLDKADP